MAKLEDVKANIVKIVNRYLKNYNERKAKGKKIPLDNVKDKVIIEQYANIKHIDKMLNIKNNGLSILEKAEVLENILILRIAFIKQGLKY